MLNLRERSLFELAKTKTNFGEVVQLCSSDNQIRDVCSKSKAFWMKIFPLIGMEHVALMFGPLKEKYWPRLIEGLIDDIFYKKYFVLTDENLEPPAGESPILNVYGLVDAQIKMDMKFSYYFEIPGLKLSSGTPAWMIEYSFDGDIDSTKSYFILSSGDGIEDINRILDYAALICYNTIQSLSSFSYSSLTIASSTADIVSDQRKLNGWILRTDEDEYPQAWRFSSDEKPTKEFLRDFISDEYGMMSHSNWFNSMIFLLSNPATSKNDSDKGEYAKLDEGSINVYRTVIN